MQCWEHLSNGFDVIGILPTGFGKSAIFQLLADIIPQQVPYNNKTKGNIVLVVGPLNSIMADQMAFLHSVGISCGIVRMPDKAEANNYNLFPSDEKKAVDENNEIEFNLDISDDESNAKCEIGIADLLTDPEPIAKDVIEGNCSVVFGHPEAFLSSMGRKLLSSDVYKKGVVAITIDEAHCVNTW